MDLPTLSKRYYSISEVSELLSIPVSTLHYWEKQDIGIKPTRNASGERKFTAKDIEHLRHIQQLIGERGLTLDGIRKYFHNRRLRQSDDEKIIASLTKLREFMIDLRGGLE
jgi:DNA-binding transcriptional MerR regulator